MRALQHMAFGDSEVLEWADAPDPHAGPGQIRIAVRAASVNPIDWKTLSGALSGGEPLAGPGYLGYDAAGVVDEVDDQVVGVSVGDEVFGRGMPTQAEYAVLDSWAVKPPSVDWALAAAAGVAGETAERGLRLLGVHAGDTILIDGGAGGVGAVTVQMALARGAKVVASASQANQDYLRELGATPVLYGEGIVARARAAADGPFDKPCLVVMAPLSAPRPAPLEFASAFSPTLAAAGPEGLHLDQLLPPQVTPHHEVFWVALTISSVLLGLC